jgi:alkylhydroperoxidase family enzyme
VTDACLARVREHFTEAEAVELTFIAGFQIFASKFAKAFRVPPQGFGESA